MLPGHYSPYLMEAITRLGTHLSFGQVPELIAFFCQVPISAETVRRITERAGAVQVAVEDRALVELEVEAPPSPEGPAIQQVSADGAMVPLLQGEWAEVRTLAIGTVDEESAEPHARDITYFSRLCDAKSFVRLAALPVYRAGTEKAEAVCAVMDGADWLQDFCDLLCPHAVRILDFPHALGHVSVAAQAVYGPGTADASEWLGEQCQRLKQGEIAAVIAAVNALPARTKRAREARRKEAAYLTKRANQMRYAAFLEAGYPIGSGMVESANKLVVEARLKGSGMHWHRENVSPMVSLRAQSCSGTWEEAWTPIWQTWRQQERSRRWRRHPRPAAPPLPPPRVPPSEPWPDDPASPYFTDGKPAPNHPWKGDTLPHSGARSPKTAKS
ncbi:MAG: hypothetical protein NVS2B16_36360 [Chloroflexota bacterium]